MLNCITMYIEWCFNPVLSVCFRIGLEVWPVLSSIGDLAYFYIPLAVLVLISSTNAINITDGLDGLATGICTIILVFFMIITNKIVS